MKRTLLISFLIGSSIFFMNAQSSTSNEIVNSVNKQSQTDSIASVSSIHKHWRIGIGGGYSYRMGKRIKESDPAADKVSKQIRHGADLDLDIQYFFKRTWGIGLLINWSSSNASGENIYMQDFGYISNYKQTNNFFHFAPTWSTCTEFNRFILTTHLGMGPLFYQQEINDLGKMSQTTLGVNSGIGMEYKVSNTTGLGLKLSYIVGNINSLNYEGTNYKLEEKQNISNLFLTGFISFKSW